MLFDVHIFSASDHTTVKLCQPGTTWMVGTYMANCPIKKAHRNHPMRLLYYVLWLAAEHAAIQAEEARQQSS